MTGTAADIIQRRRGKSGRGVLRARLIARPARMPRPLASTDDDRGQSVGIIGGVGDAVSLRFGTTLETAEVLDVEITRGDGEGYYEGTLRRSTARGQGGDLRFQEGATIRFGERHIFTVRRHRRCT